MIKKQRVQARQVNTDHGLVWQIASSSLSTQPSTFVGQVITPQVAQPDQGAGLLELVKLTRELTERNIILEQENGDLKRDQIALQSELTQAREQLALAAPKVEEQPAEEVRPHFA